MRSTYTRWCSKLGRERQILHSRRHQQNRARVVGALESASLSSIEFPSKVSHQTQGQEGKHHSDRTLICFHHGGDGLLLCVPRTKGVKGGEGRKSPSSDSPPTNHDLLSFLLPLNPLLSDVLDLSTSPLSTHRNQKRNYSLLRPGHARNNLPVELRLPRALLTSPLSRRRTRRILFSGSSFLQ